MERQISVNDNTFLGSFRLDGIPPSPRGVPQLQLKFDIDTNGVLSVTALNKGTGKEKAITITGACTLPQHQINEMVRETEEFAEDDREKKDGIDTRNQANSMFTKLRRIWRMSLHSFICLNSLCGCLVRLALIPETNFVS